MRYFVRETVKNGKKVVSKKSVEVTDETALKTLNLTVLTPPTAVYPFLENRVTGIGRDIVTKHTFLKFKCPSGEKIQGTFIRNPDGSLVHPDGKAHMTTLDFTSLTACNTEVEKDTGDLGSGTGTLCPKCLDTVRAARGKGKGNEGVAVTPEAEALARKLLHG